MTVRGGGIPRRPLALTPNGRMGPPLRSFAADAHDCIMVRVLGPTGYKVVARLNRARKRAPSDRHRDRIQRAVVLEAVKVWPGKAEACRKVVRRPTLTASHASTSAMRGSGDFEIKSRD
jgi:hypothetical protein